MAITIRKIACPEPPVGADLMKTGQTTSYRTGDDGDIEAGRATDFFTLAVNNPFGNTNRFTDELGGSTYANNIVIDWSTYNGSNVLGYYRILSSTMNWNGAVDWALALSVGTFTNGWRLVNINEYLNTCLTDGTNDKFENRIAPFNLTSSQIWTSNSTSATTAWFAQNYLGTPIVNGAKSSNYKSFGCRTFTVTGTTLT